MPRRRSTRFRSRRQTETRSRRGALNPGNPQSGGQSPAQGAAPGQPAPPNHIPDCSPAPRKTTDPDKKGDSPDDAIAGRLAD